MRVSHAAVLILAGAALAARAGNGDNAYSFEKETALGQKLAADLREHTTPINIPAVQDYLDRLGQRLAAQVPGAKSAFTFSAIADDPCPASHEPAALPGGYVFVPAALFLAARDEAEFAGMLAHAMEHVAQRHLTREASRSQFAGYASIPAIFAARVGCAGVQAVPLAVRAWRQGHELEADALALETMAYSGFDPAALDEPVRRA